MAYDNNMRGVLFKNDKKETDKHPDYTGKIEVENVEYRLAAWIKQGKNGKFMSLAVSVPKEENHNHPDPDGDDVPF